MTPQESEAIALLYASPYEHFLTMAAIEDKEHKLIRGEQIVPSKFQKEIFQAYEWMLREGMPIRIIPAPKSRQSYGSTSVGHICYHHTRRFKCNAMVMADEFSRTEKLWEMLKRYALHDNFNPYWDSRIESNAEKIRIHYEEVIENQRVKRVATWDHETANDPKAGAAGTRQVLWFSECMRYPREGVAADTIVIPNAINSMPGSTANTVVFLESTAEGGPSGYVYELLKDAVPLKAVVRGTQGRYWNGWISVFGAWHECSDYRLDRKLTIHIPWFDDTNPRFGKFKGREEAGKRLYNWMADQIAWRRMKIIQEFAGDETMMDRDYPACPEDAFRASSNARFDHAGLARLRVMAEKDYPGCQRGNLVVNEGSARFQLDEQDGWVWIYQKPMQGAGYCVFGDFMEGEQATGKPDSLDCHAVGILREAFRDERGVEWPDEVVAAIDIPNGCRWDTDVLAERMKALSLFYGSCIIVPEYNNSGAVVVKLLQQMGLTIYQRRAPDHTDPNKTVKALGFKTTAATKPRWVEALATAIREESDEPPKFLCRFLPAVKEFGTFVRNPDGSCSAMGSHHDDWCAGIGIALYCRAFTKYAGSGYTREEGAGYYAFETPRANQLTAPKGSGAFG